VAAYLTPGLNGTSSLQFGLMSISMESLEGETLTNKIEREPLKIEDAVYIAIQVAHGLARAHALRLVFSRLPEPFSRSQRRSRLGELCSGPLLPLFLQ
jgi:hypothetical protein